MFLRRQVQLVLAGKNGSVVFRKAHLDHCIVLRGTQQNADGGVRQSLLDGGQPFLLCTGNDALNTGKAEADLICLYDEVIDDTKPLEIFDPQNTWKRKTLTNFTATELLVPIFKGGELVYDLPSLNDIRRHCEEEREGMWEEVRRFTNPHNYYVDLSQKLWDIKHELLNRRGG